MRKLSILTILMLMAVGAEAQQYNFTFKLAGSEDTMLYIARHFRDQLEFVDTAARRADGSYRFNGKKKWERGVYALVHQDRKRQVGDFAVDASRKFTINGDAKMTPESVQVSGCEANKQMFSYLATEDKAKREMDSIRVRMKNKDTKAQAEADERALVERMTAYEATARYPKNSNVFFDLVNACDSPEVPDSIEAKAVYYRTHYWDKFFEIRNSKFEIQNSLLYSPHLFNKMNYFFFGMLYHAESDTICKEIDRLAKRFDYDSAMLRYIFDYIEPRYFRSTKNIGWDAVWCHLASEYYLKGRCPWATQGTLHNMRYNYNRIRQSLIGAHGQELFMIDTTQIDSPEHWVSSHRFPTRYVILWFWDPDCHHCQEQSEQLKVLYDSMLTAPERRFEVYAVGYEADIAKWKRYVKEHNFKWVNVGGANVNIDYQEAYNVHGAPTMIILNERRDIIMNKVLPISNLMGFLDDYEKRVKK